MNHYNTYINEKYYPQSSHGAKNLTILEFIYEKILTNVVRLLETSDDITILVDINNVDILRDITNMTIIINNESSQKISLPKNKINSLWIYD